MVKRKRASGSASSERTTAVAAALWTAGSAAAVRDAVPVEWTAAQVEVALRSGLLSGWMQQEGDGTSRVKLAFRLIDAAFEWARERGGHPAGLALLPYELSEWVVELAAACASDGEEVEAVMEEMLARRELYAQAAGFARGKYALIRALWGGLFPRLMGRSEACERDAQVWARAMLFMAGVFPVGDRSAVNLKGVARYRQRAVLGLGDRDGRVDDAAADTADADAVSVTLRECVEWAQRAPAQGDEAELLPHVAAWLSAAASDTCTHGSHGAALSDAALLSPVPSFQNDALADRVLRLYWVVRILMHVSFWRTERMPHWEERLWAHVEQCWPTRLATALRDLFADERQRWVAWKSAGCPRFERDGFLEAGDEADREMVMEFFTEAESEALPPPPWQPIDDWQALEVLAQQAAASSTDELDSLLLSPPPSATPPASADAVRQQGIHIAGDSYRWLLLRRLRQLDPTRWLRYADSHRDIEAFLSTETAATPTPATTADAR
eukprot:ctg_42.g5